MTRNARSGAAVCLWLICGLGACGGEDDSSIADAPAEFGRGYCPKLFECCTADELGEKFEGADPPVTDVAGCEAYYGALGAFFELSLDPDRTTYRPERLSACLEDLAGWSCEELRAREPLADRFCDAVEGLVEPGGECRQDMECASGYCDAEQTCRALPAVGDACSDDCGAGLYCRITDSGNVCVAVKADGEPCNFDNTCASGSCSDGVCGPPNECLAGLLRVRCGPCTE